MPPAIAVLPSGKLAKRPQNNYLVLVARGVTMPGPIV